MFPVWQLLGVTAVSLLSYKRKAYPLHFIPGVPASAQPAQEFGKWVRGGRLFSFIIPTLRTDMINQLISG